MLNKIVPRTNHLHLLENVLSCAAQAPGNRQRFAAAGLLGDEGRLVTDWQTNWQDGFARLGVLRKAELRANPGAFLANASDVVYRGKTSGTTSDAFTYFAGEVWNQKRVEARSRNQGWWGFSEAPVVNVASRLGPVSKGDSSLVGTVDYEFLVALLKIVGGESGVDGPVVLRGYPSRLCEVAIALHNNQLKLPQNSVVAVVATGECLFEVQRSLLKQTFNAPVVNEYGCQESGISGMSCPEAGRVHLDEDRCLYEIIDGELVTTDLWNTTMPMVRYVSGDEIAPYADPCPCGRPGLTVKILGRQLEETLSPSPHAKKSGEFNLPAFPGILNYQVRIENTQRRVWVQPDHLLKDSALQEATLAPIKTWFEHTFGIGDTEVLMDSPFAHSSGELASNNLSAMSSQAWLAAVTQQKWTGWIEQPLPMGTAKDVAALLQQMVIPQQIVGGGMGQKALALMQTVKKSALTSDDSLEVMKLRVLFWAVSLMTQNGDAEEVEQLYGELMTRFREWRDRCKNLSSFSALGFDLFAPLLTLNNGSKHWKAIREIVSEGWPNGIKADRFTVHHYLTVVDVAGQNAQRRGHRWKAGLRPLSAVLLGDFYRVGSALDVAQVELWMEMVHEMPGAFERAERGEEFMDVWRGVRRSLLKKDKQDSFRQIEKLFALADTPKRLAQCWLEKGYGNLVFEERFEPDEWLKILSEQIGVLTTDGKAAANPAVSNPMAWSPILKALAPELVKSGKPDLAYACLFAAAPPNRQMSGFDRRSVGVNGKQAVISVQ